MGRSGGGGPGAGGFQQSWNFHSSVDPEELFRKIFGDRGFAGNPFSNEEDFADSAFGYGAAQEVGDVRSTFVFYFIILLKLLSGVHF